MGRTGFAFVIIADVRFLLLVFFDPELGQRKVLVNLAKEALHENLPTLVAEVQVNHCPAVHVALPGAVVLVRVVGTQTEVTDEVGVHAIPQTLPGDPIGPS